MTRETLFEITKRYRLQLAVDRIVTGNAQGGFHQFEFTGKFENCRSAAIAIRDAWPLTGSSRVDFVQVRRSQIDGAPYLLVDSFWCGRPQGDRHAPD